MRLLILFLSLISTHSLWEELESGARLRALDRSKMFDVKIRGHGYFQYIMNV